jgi:hypothetical protein
MPTDEERDMDTYVSSLNQELKNISANSNNSFISTKPASNSLVRMYSNDKKCTNFDFYYCGDLYTFTAEVIYIIFLLFFYN